MGRLPSFIPGYRGSYTSANESPLDSDENADCWSLPPVSDSVPEGCSSRMYISDGVPGGADGPHLENHCLRSLKTVPTCVKGHTSASCRGGHCEVDVGKMP